MLPFVHAISNLSWSVEAHGDINIYVNSSLEVDAAGADSGTYVISSELSRTVEVYALPDTGYDGQIVLDGITYDVEYLSFASGFTDHTIAVEFTAATPTPTPAPTSGNYNFTGPYYDNRDVATENVTVTLLYVNGTIYTFDLVGDGVTADTHSVLSTTELKQAVWNASTALNYTRFYDFTGPSDVEVDIHIPDPDTNVYTYYFTVSDFYGMTLAYLETRTTDNGVDYYTVERKTVNVATLSFIMQQYYDYQLMFTNDLGSEDFEYYIISFTPENIFTRDLPVLPGSFPVTDIEGISATAYRLNSTAVGITYSDGDLSTDWLYVNITHFESGYSTLDYNLNLTDTNSFSLVWNSADEETTYIVSIVPSRNGTLYPYQFTCAVSTSDNPWDGILDFLGSWPAGIDSAQVIASALILAFLCIGSTRSLGAACLLSWIVGALLLVIGWWTPSIPTFILAGVMSVLIAVEEGKQTVREV